MTGIWLFLNNPANVKVEEFQIRPCGCIKSSWTTFLNVLPRWLNVTISQIPNSCLPVEKSNLPI